MKAIVISSKNSQNDEAVTIVKLFLKGLEFFHLDKPFWEEEELAHFIKKIPPRFHRNIVLHQHYALCSHFALCGVHLLGDEEINPDEIHELFSLQEERPDLHVSKTFRDLKRVVSPSLELDYQILEQVVSLETSHLLFDEKLLQATLKQSSIDVFAHCEKWSEERGKQLLELGFSGVALSELLWKTKDPVATFVKIKDLGYP